MDGDVFDCVYFRDIIIWGYSYWFKIVSSAVDKKILWLWKSCALGYLDIFIWCENINTMAEILQKTIVSTLVGSISLIFE